MLAFASEKKRRYGLKSLNKEEKKRLKERTEWKIELAQAKSNYWKWHRRERKGERGKEEENEAIRARLRKEISALDEEDGDWRKELAMTKKGGSVEVETGVVPDGVSEAVAINEMQGRAEQGRH